MQESKIWLFGLELSQIDLDSREVAAVQLFCCTDIPAVEHAPAAVGLACQLVDAQMVVYHGTSDSEVVQLETEVCCLQVLNVNKAEPDRGLRYPASLSSEYSSVASPDSQ